MSNNIINITIIAQVDHRNTTMNHNLIKQTFRIDVYEQDIGQSIQFRDEDIMGHCFFTMAELIHNQRGLARDVDGGD